MLKAPGFSRSSRPILCSLIISYFFGIIDAEAVYEAFEYLLRHPEIIGHEIGFKDMTALHGLWIREMVFGTEDYTLQGHRGSFKSSALSVAIALLMILKPDKGIIFLRKTDPDVAEMMTRVSKILSSQIVKDLVALMYDTELEITEEAQGKIVTNLWQSPSGAPQIRGLGIKSSITGSHADIVITDDICNIMDRISRAERERTKLQYAELQNIRNRGGRIINLGTPWHKEDVFTMMPNLHRYDCYSTGLILPEKLQSLRKSMSASLFAANYELKHIADEDALFRSAPEFFANEKLLYNGISHIDCSYGGADYTAFTCARLEDGILYLYGRLWHRHVSEVLDECLALADRFRCWPLYTEDNGDKGFVVREIRGRGKFGRAYHEDTNKYVKISTHLVEWWPRIRFLEASDPEYIAQIMDYTPDADHDDAPDSAACCCRILDRHGRRRAR